MVPLAPIFKRAYWAAFFGVTFYAVALIALTNPWLQRKYLSVLYGHKVQAWWVDSNKPEQFGFARNQITPFNFTTPDLETIYAWHVMPLGLYAKHESEILQQPAGCAEDITKTKAFQLLTEDPESRLIINCKFLVSPVPYFANDVQFTGYGLPLGITSHKYANDHHQYAGTVRQGWRTDSYRAFGIASNIHVLAIDYRGYGLSTGFPTEEGIIIDGIAAVDWAMQVAKIPSDRIVIIGQSLGTAVTSAVVEHYADRGTEFAGVIIVAGFIDMPNLLTSYSLFGWVPILSPLKPYPPLQRLFASYLVDKWPSASRLANFVRVSKRVRLFIIHANDDNEIPWHHSETLFAITANATTDGGMELDLIKKMKARNTVDMGDGAFVSTWKAGGDKIIREEIVPVGRHNRILTYAPVALAILKAFNLDDGGALPL